MGLVQMGPQRRSYFLQQRQEAFVVDHKLRQRLLQDKTAILVQKQHTRSGLCV